MVTPAVALNDGVELPPAPEVVQTWSDDVPLS